MSRIVRLARHVRACVDKDYVIFLDLRRDRYWRARVADVPELSLETGSGARQDGDARMIDKLMALDLLEPGLGPAPMSETPSRPMREADQELRQSEPMRFDTKAAFVHACLWAAGAVRARRLDKTFAQIAARKRWVFPRRRQDACARDIGRFAALRPWFPKSRVCLFDSLALMHFLLARNHAPDLVVAARAEPFAAHCWLEEDGAVLNDALERCAAFAPLAKV